jgi:hypothetical protein
MFEAKAWKFSDARCPMPDYKISYSVLSATIRVRQAYGGREGGAKN